MFEQEKIWERLKYLKQIQADGMFTCVNQQGDKVLLLYSEKEKIFMTICVESKNTDLDFTPSH